MKRSFYGLSGCCQICGHRLEDSGHMRQVGCNGTKYPDRLCPENRCRRCIHLFEYDDERTARIIEAEVYFNLEGCCVFYGKLNYANAKGKVRKVRIDNQHRASK